MIAEPRHGDGWAFGPSLTPNVRPRDWNKWKKEETVMKKPSIRSFLLLLCFLLHVSSQAAYASQQDDIDAINSLMLDIKGYNSRGMEQRAQAEIQNFGTRQANYVPILLRYLSDETPTARFYTARALGRIGSSARNAIPELMRAYQKESDLDVRVNLVWALAEIVGPSDKTVIPVFAKALQEKDVIRNNVFTNLPEEPPTATERSRICALVGLNRLNLNPKDSMTYPCLVEALKQNLNYHNANVCAASSDLLARLKTPGK